MISPLISKVNPSNFADFAALRAAVLWWKVLNPLYNPARLPPTWPAPASASDAVGVGPRGLQLLTARGAYWGLGSGCERNRLVGVEKVPQPNGFSSASMPSPVFLSPFD
jgi:hypothetical protein